MEEMHVHDMHDRGDACKTANADVVSSLNIVILCMEPRL